MFECETIQEEKRRKTQQFATLLKYCSSINKDFSSWFDFLLVISEGNDSDASWSNRNLITNFTLTEQITIRDFRSKHKKRISTIKTHGKGLARMKIIRFFDDHHLGTTCSAIELSKRINQISSCCLLLCLNKKNQS